MAKRSLSMLLAIVTLFSLAVPAFAEEEPIVTEAPVATEVPVATEEPVVTEEPVATEEPVVTEEPVATEEPVEATEELVATEEPEPVALEDEIMPVAAATSGNCGSDYEYGDGDSVQWSFSGGTLTISGTGVMGESFENGDRGNHQHEHDDL